MRRVRPHRDAEPRSLPRFRGEVLALLVTKGISKPRAKQLMQDWKDYIEKRWKMGRPPCAVSDHVARWRKEKVVCPCRRGGDPSPSCKVHGRRRVGRDADNPRPGEVYEGKTSGRRWEVVSVDGERIVVKPVGARSEGELVWSKRAFKQMKPMGGVLQSIKEAILGPAKEEPRPVPTRFESPLALPDPRRPRRSRRRGRPRRARSRR